MQHTRLSFWDIEHTTEIYGCISTVVESKAWLVIRRTHVAVKFLVLGRRHFFGIHEPNGLNAVGLFTIHFNRGAYKATVFLDDVCEEKWKLELEL